MLISYKGKNYNTTYDFELLSDDECNFLITEYYKKPDFEKVQKEFKTIDKGGVKNTDITNYYVRDLMDKVLNCNNKWCIEDVFNSKELLSLFWYRTKLNNKVFLPTDSTRRKLDTIFRIGAMGLVSRPSNFPIKTVDEVLNRYNVNNNWYDFSCGWGARLTGALKNKVNYYGTDPNYLLTERLEQLADDYKSSVGISNIVTDIRTQGSEEFIPEWENKMGLAFSSPPYFNLEDYKIGNQSYKEGTSYENWKEDYLKPTFQNIKRYLVNEGYFLINIKNTKEHNLVEDTLKIAKELGFCLDDIVPLKLCKKSNIKVDNKFIAIDENIYVFRKSVEQKNNDYTINKFIDEEE